MEGRFGMYLGFLKVEIGEGMEKTDFEVRPSLRHKQQLLGVQKNAKKGLSEDDWEKQHSIFKEILKTGNIPEEEKTDENLNAFLLKHDMDFMMVLYVGFGWAKAEDLFDLKEELRRKAM